MPDNGNQRFKAVKQRFTTVLSVTALVVFASAAYSQTVYNVACSVTDLRNAVTAANADGTDSVLDLSAGCDYLFVDGPFLDNGNNALPTIADDGSMTIRGNGATVRRDASLVCMIADANDTADEFRLANVADNGQVLIEDLTARDFCSTGNGGVIEGLGYLDLTVSDSTFEDNTADGDGGVFEANDAFYTFRDSFFRRNQARSDGGAAEASVVTFDILRSEFTENDAGLNGGALRGSIPSYRIRDSLFARNRSDGDSGALHSSGGPEYSIVGSTFDSNEAANNGGALRTPGSETINILNSTFAGNRAGTDGTGTSGAIHAFSNIIVLISNSTFYDNAGASGAAFSLDNDPTFEARNSIFDNPNGDLCIDGTFGTGQDNFLSDATCDPVGDLDFDLGAVSALQTTLADNGGPTPTLALLAGSNAIDAVSDCTARSGGPNPYFGDGDPVVEDQRYRPRPAGSACDAGAFEEGVSVLEVPTVSTIGRGSLIFLLAAFGVIALVRPRAGL